MAGVEDHEIWRLAISPNVVFIYTDGSIRRAPQKAAAGPASPAGCSWVRFRHQVPFLSDYFFGRYYSLGLQVNSEYVELIAIYLALQALVEEMNDVGKLGVEVKLFSDCDYALTRITDARNGSPPDSTVVREIFSLIETLEVTWRMTVTLRWVPSHRGAAGNDRADSLAKAGAQRYLDEGCIGIGWSVGVGNPDQEHRVHHPQPTTTPLE